MSTDLDKRIAVARLVELLRDEPAAQQKTCPACHATFPCLPGACWCASLQLSPTTRRALREKYDNCLCPSCLVPLSE